MSLSGLNPFTESLPRVDLTTDTTLELLQNPRRRFALAMLYERGEVIGTAELVDARTAVEQGGDYSRTERKRVYVAYQQTHLPRLDRAGVINYENTGTIRLTEQVGPLVQLSERIDRACSGGHAND